MLFVTYIGFFLVKGMQQFSLGALDRGRGEIAEFRNAVQRKTSAAEAALLSQLNGTDESVPLPNALAAPEGARKSI